MMKTDLVALVDKLVSSSDELKPVHVVKLGCNLVAKEPAGAARADSPSLDVFGVGPNKIAESAFMGDLLRTGNNADLVDGADLRTKTTMDAEKFSIDDGSEDKEVEDMAARLPHGSVAILLLTLLVESVHLGDLTGLMVATNENDSVRVPKDD